MLTLVPPPPPVSHKFIEPGIVIHFCRKTMKGVSCV